MISDIVAFSRNVAKQEVAQDGMTRQGWLSAGGRALTMRAGESRALRHL
jgi:hypothetical protein